MTAIADSRAAEVSLADLKARGVVVIHAEGHTIAVFYNDGAVRAVDNRCPHMGFPLHQGTVEDGILTCHWHHARFDLCTGGTFDPFADDVRAFPVDVQDDRVTVRLDAPAGAPVDRYRARLKDGMRQNLRLVIAKAVLGLEAAGAQPSLALLEGAEFGTRNARNGWGPGLTILTAMGNILPRLLQDDRGRALYHGLTHVAREVAGQAPAFVQEPLPDAPRDAATLKGWFRRFVEVRNRDGAERVIQTAVAAGLPPQTLADMICAAATDHLYLDGGHAMDFSNKAFELLDLIGWDQAGDVLTSLAGRLAGARRSEENSNWRHPIDLASLLSAAFEDLPEAVRQGRSKAGTWERSAGLTDCVLSDDPHAIVDGLMAAVMAGADLAELARIVAMAAARRIAQFHTSNEFGDWDTALHTFSYANAVHQAMKRAPSSELLRGVFDAAISVYLDRFLNMPPAALPGPDAAAPPIDSLLDMLNTQQQVNEVGRLVSAHVWRGGHDAELMAAIGQGMLREDADFHTIQTVEAAFRQHADAGTDEDRRIALIAAGRYLAAHCPTNRAMGQTYRIAARLHRGERIYEG